MDEHELRESLRRLPDARPGGEFTAEVLARVERFERRRSTAAGGRAGERLRGTAARWRPTLLAGGLAGALVAAVGLWQPLGGGRWSATGGGEVAVPADARIELPAEGSGGEPPGGGESAAPGAVRAAEDADGHRRLGGEHTTPVGPPAEGFAAGGPMTESRVADSGVGAVNGSQAPAAARPGASGRPSSPAGADPPGRRAAQHPPLADRGSAATGPGGAVGEERFTIAAGAAGGSTSSGSAPEARRGATASTADTLAALPGADFFAAPPANTAPAAAEALAAVPAAQRLARLRAERESLERRLVAFRRELPPAEPPVVLLGGDEGLELVFDLGRWAAAAPAAGDAAGAARPAVHSTQGPPRRF